MMKFKRNKCKICGGKAQIKHFRNPYGWRYYVFCRKCYSGATWHSSSKEEAKETAVQFWNNARPRKSRAGILDWSKKA